LKQTIALLIPTCVAVLLLPASAAAQQWEEQPAPEPGGWDTPPPPPPPPPEQPLPPTNPQPAPPTAFPAPGQPAAGAATAPPRRVAFSGLRNEADVAPQDVEFLESIVLNALIPLTSKGFEVIPDNNASEFCGDACALELAAQTGAELMVHGGISIFAGGYAVTLKLHRVATSQLVHSSTTDSRPLLGELVGPVQTAAEELARALEIAQPPPPPAPPPPPQPVVQPISPQTDPGYWWPTDDEAPGEEPEEEAEGGFPHPTRGLDLELRAGFNFCAESGEATCENFEMGGGGGAFIGIRFVPMFAAGLDFGAYGLKLKDTFGASDVKVSSRHFMLTPRLYFPFRIAEIYVELGFLYHGVYEDGEQGGDKYSVKLSSWASFKLGAGLTFYIVRGKRVGDIGLGIDLDYNFFSPKDVELCGGEAEGSKCDEQSWSSYIDDLEELAEGTDLTEDMVDFIQFSFHLTWLVPIF
jgi:hypothetical protein